MAHDRQYRTLSLSPKVIMVDDVLTPDECDQMVARGTDMPPSEQIHANAESEKIYTNYRTSGTTSLPDDAFVLGVRQRVLRLAVLLKPDVAFLSRRQRAPQLGLREQIARGEGLQLVRYHPGQWFKKHTDYFDHSVGWRTSTDVHAYTRARVHRTYLRSLLLLLAGSVWCVHQVWAPTSERYKSRNKTSVEPNRHATFFVYVADVEEVS
jgi:hypothetical protein